MTTIICFWCREVDKEEVLPEREDGEPAPERAIVDYTPCHACRQKFNDGILFAEVETEPQSPGQFPISEQQVDNAPESPLYPTGRYIVVNEDFVPQIMKDEAAKECLMSRHALVTREIFELLAPEDSSGQTIN